MTLFNCAICGKGINGGTTVNGLMVCDWCKPAHKHVEPSPSQDEFDESAITQAVRKNGSWYYRESDFKAGARWQFNKMKRKSTEGG